MELGSGNAEVGSGTRRRPIGRDYAAAEDAEFGCIIRHPILERWS